MPPFELVASNGDTTVSICRKLSLMSALSLADDLISYWDDIWIREYPEDNETHFKVVARLSQHGLL